MDEIELFELTKEQQRAFDRLKKAHADCLKAGIYFYNNYGSLGALDRKKFGKRPFDDDKNAPGAIYDEGQNSHNELTLGCGEWCDDPHYFNPA